MADGNGVHVVDAALGEPRAQIGRHARAHQAALVTADGVESQRGAGLVHGADVSVGHQAELDERLEAVADAQHEAVAGLQQVTNGLGDLGRAEECGDELGRAVGLVSAREAARQHDDLALPDAAH